MLPHQLVAMNTLRYSITTRPLQSGAEIRVVQGLLGPVDVSARMLYRPALWWRAFRVRKGIGSRCCRNPPHLMGDVGRAN